MPVHSFLRLPLALITIMALLLVLVTACGSPHSRQVRGELPSLSLDSLTRVDDQIEVTIGIRNHNDASLKVDSIQIALSIDEMPATNLNDEQLDLKIGARGREVIQLVGQGDGKTHEKLDLLAENERASLPWSMDVDLSLDGRRTRQTEVTGFVHRVPGHPDRFR